MYVYSYIIYIHIRYTGLAKLRLKCVYIYMHKCLHIYIFLFCVYTYIYMIYVSYIHKDLSLSIYIYVCSLCLPSEQGFFVFISCQHQMYCSCTSGSLSRKGLLQRGPGSECNVFLFCAERSNIKSRGWREKIEHAKQVSTDRLCLHIA